MADEHLGGGVDGRMEAAGPQNWTLPDWGAFSGSCASGWSSSDAWSDVDADGSVETSSVDSTQHQRIYREHRARRRPGERGSGSERTERDLRELHLFYLEQRRRAGGGMGGNQEEDEEKALSGARSVDTAQEKLVETQAEMQTEIKAVRQQLTSFQEKWAGANAAKVTGSVGQGHSSLDDAVQRDTARQWLLLLAQKIDAVAQDYAHGPSQSFLATVAHLANLKGPETNQQATHNDKQEQVGAEGGETLLQSSGWNDLKAMASPDLSEQIGTLEKAVGRLTESVRGYSRRQLDCFDQSVRQLQAFHNDRVQRVVDESIEELKLVRGRYRKKEERLEMELRLANRSVHEWQFKVKQVEQQHKMVLQQLATAEAQVESDRKQYEADLLRVRELLESAYAEKEEEIGRRQSDHENSSFSLEQTRAQVSELQARCKALIAQQESAKELYDLENLTLRHTVDDLRQRLAATQSEHDQEKQRLEATITERECKHHDELDRLEAQVKERTRAKVLENELPAREREIERRYADQLQSFKRDHDVQVADLTARIEEATASVSSAPVQQQAIAIQTDEALEGIKFDNDGDDERVKDLTRKCRALEKLLDKKFEDASESLASSRLCASCHSENASLHLNTLSRASSQLLSVSSPDSRQPRSIEKSKALARALLSSSRTSLEDALFPDAVGDEDDTMATEEQTTMNAVDMWDSASFTSIDSVDEASSLRPLPSRTPSPPTPSTKEMAALARKLKRFATNAAASSSSATSSYREPDPELNSDARAAAPRRFKTIGEKKTTYAGRLSALDSKVAASDRRPPMATTGFSSFDDLLQSISSRQTSPN